MNAPLKTPARLVSLDVFRGITMAGMVVVNNPGDWGHVYAPLLHAPWHGWTPTDMVFPFFLFIVGVSMTLSRGTMGSPWKILRRGLIIFGLGLFMAGWPRFPLDTWRIPGVLQRIALCYLAAAVLFRHTAPPPAEGDARLRSHGIRLASWAVGLTLGYWALVMLVPVPGGAAGVLERGQDLGAYIDRTVLGGHLWSQSKTWDPEGLLSTIPAIATTLLGLVAGLWLASSASAYRKAAGLAVAGLAGIAIGLVWSTVFPLNKNLWTSSYVWFMGGAASLCLSACYWLVDVKGWTAWGWPFKVLGLNAILLFVASGMLAKWMGLRRLTMADGKTMSLRGYIYQQYFVPLGDPYQASLQFALANLAVMFVLLYVMYRRKWFLKV
jgi:predicted acyltransferase